MVVERCGCLEAVLRCWCEGTDDPFWELRDVAEEPGAAFSGVMGSVTSVRDETRLMRFLTLLDLERLCLRHT
jgi:hypothetical protein